MLRISSGSSSFLAGLMLACSLVFALPLHASTWFALGPYGGDARSFAADPHDSRHLYLGTLTGWLYESHDGGSTWTRVSQVGSRSDLVLARILVDPVVPNRLMVAGWIVDRPDGGLYISDDGGKSWYPQEQMRGQSVRSLTRSLSNPSEIVAGTLKGVFESLDNGTHWKQISPADSTDIHEVESVAIDPSDPKTIYAGTWHLPWKTTDGGKTWTNINSINGLIDDSDVFSIIIDPVNPRVVYASACSGIYKSENSGGHFDKVQGIPKTARRTRKLMQDPTKRTTVYAGTTEGLYRTLDAGAHWDRVTNGDLVVNDVYVDPADAQHILLATDRGGVLASDDGAATFHASNSGFSARQVTSFAQDPQRPGTVFAGVVNDKETGGVFQSNDGALHWQQKSSGLSGRDVFALAETSDGTLIAGTNRGILRLAEAADAWTEASIEPPVRKAVPLKVAVPRAAAPIAHTKASAKLTHSAAHGKAGAKPASNTRKKVVNSKSTAKTPAAKKPTASRAVRSAASHQATAPAPAPLIPTGDVATSAAGLAGEIFTLVPGRGSIYAGTAAGLYRSDAAGLEWQLVAELSLTEVHFFGQHDDLMVAGSLKRLMRSSDAGATWSTMPLPPGLTQIGALAVDSLNDVWIGGREGLYYSPDLGATWKQLTSLYIIAVDSIYFDPIASRILVTTSESNFVFSAQLPSFKVTYWDTGWRLRFARPVGDHLVGGTLYDGVVVQPQMVISEPGPVRHGILGSSE